MGRNRLLTHKLRQFAFELRTAHADRVAIDELREQRKPAMLKTALEILLTFFGAPPERFDWTYYDKSKKFHAIRGLTPLEFFEQCVPFRLADQVSLVNDPRTPYHKLYTVARLGNVVGGRAAKQ